MAKRSIIPEQAALAMYDVLGSGAAIQLYVYYCMKRNGTSGGWRCPRRAVLAEIRGFDKRTYHRAQNRLLELGWIVVEASDFVRPVFGFENDEIDARSDQNETVETPETVAADSDKNDTFETSKGDKNDTSESSKSDTFDTIAETDGDKNDTPKQAKGDKKDTRGDKNVTLLNKETTTRYNEKKTTTKTIAKRKKESELTLEQKLAYNDCMKFLEESVGKFKDYAAQGGALRWMLQNGATAAQIKAGIERQKRTYSPDFRVSFLSLQKQIFPWIKAEQDGGLNNHNGQKLDARSQRARDEFNELEALRRSVLEPDHPRAG